MFNKFISLLAIISIFPLSAFSLYGQTKNVWAAVENLAGQEVAVKTRNGKMHYGIVKASDSDKIVLQIAGKKRLSQDEMTFEKSEVKKIWRALLFVNDRNTGKGALIGAGVGTVTIGVPALAEGSDDGLHGAGLFLGAIGGAAAGGIVGFFTRKKHKKRDLIYKN